MSVDIETLLSDALTIQQYQHDTIFTLSANYNQFGLNANDNETPLGVIPKLFELNSIFTKFCEQLTELILSKGLDGIDPLISCYDYTYKSLLQLLINLDIIDQDVTVESFSYPFILKNHTFDDFSMAIDIGASLAKIVFITLVPMSDKVQYCIEIYNNCCKFTYYFQLLLSHIINKHRHLLNVNSHKFSDGELNDLGRIYNFPSGAIFQGLKNEVMKIKLDDSKYIAFKTFPANQIDVICEFVLENCKSEGKIYATGGGCLKYKQEIEQKHGSKLIFVDEMEAVASGSKLLFKIDHSLYMYDRQNNKICIFKNNKQFPFLVVNVGSGTSVLKISQEGSCRVNGSSIGGGTLIGSFRYLSLKNDFRSIQIDCECLYNKQILCINHLLDTKITTESISNVKMIYEDIGVIGELNARNCGANAVIFTGSTICGFIPALSAITSSFPNTFDVVFSHHGGFVGALGALITKLKQ